MKQLQSIVNLEVKWRNELANVQQGKKDNDPQKIGQKMIENKLEEIELV